LIIDLKIEHIVIEQINPESEERSRELMKEQQELERQRKSVREEIEKQ
jgi:hypothetical protein